MSSGKGKADRRGRAPECLKACFWPESPEGPSSSPHDVTCQKPGSPAHGFFIDAVTPRSSLQLHNSSHICRKKTNHPETAHRSRRQCDEVHARLSACLCLRIPLSPILPDPQDRGARHPDGTTAALMGEPRFFPCALLLCLPQC